MYPAVLVDHSKTFIHSYELFFWFQVQSAAATYASHVSEVCDESYAAIVVSLRGYFLDFALEPEILLL